MRVAKTLTKTLLSFAVKLRGKTGFLLHDADYVHVHVLVQLHIFVTELCIFTTQLQHTLYTCKSIFKLVMVVKLHNYCAVRCTYTWIFFNVQGRA